MERGEALRIFPVCNVFFRGSFFDETVANILCCLVRYLQDSAAAGDCWRNEKECKEQLSIIKNSGLAD